MVHFLSYYTTDLNYYIKLYRVEYGLQLTSGYFIYLRKQQLVGIHVSWQAHKRRMYECNEESFERNKHRWRGCAKQRKRESEIGRTCVRSDNIETMSQEGSRVETALDVGRVNSARIVSNMSGMPQARRDVERVTRDIWVEKKIWRKFQREGWSWKSFGTRPKTRCYNISRVKKVKRCNKT